MIIRHGEKPKVGNGLTIDGEHRAEYIGKCAVKKTIALVLGAPTYLMAAKNETGKSYRARDTITPLSYELKLPVDLSVDKEDMDGFRNVIDRLPCDATAMVAWEHTNIPLLIQTLKAPNLKEFAVWPDQCDSDSWKEPSDVGGRACIFNFERAHACVCVCERAHASVCVCVCERDCVYVWVVGTLTNAYTVPIKL